MSTLGLLLCVSLSFMMRSMVDYSYKSRGQRIARAIKLSGLSQRSIAAKIGVTPQSTTKWLKTGNIKCEHLLELARLTKTDLVYLIEGASKEGVSEPAASYSSAPESELIQVMASLSEIQLKKLYLCAQALLVNQDGDLDVKLSLGGKEISL